MPRLVSGVLAGLAGALVLAAAGSAATSTVQIKSTGFSPSSLTVNHGDKVTFRNVDNTDHQVVADNGSFASPILHANQSWTTGSLTAAGTFRYHDALHPRLTGKVTVKGPPPAVSLALSLPIVSFGQPITLSGTVSSGAANESVELDQQPWGQPSQTQVAVIKTGTNGAYSYSLTPSIYTTYVARWKNVASASVVAQVAPTMHLVPGGGGYMKVVIASPVSLWHRHVYLQRLSQYGQWVNIAALTLGQQNGRLFQPTAYLPKGVSHIRVFLSVNQAGNGLLASHTGTQTIVRKR
ncbi:MAG TPA: cupredoxin domain-containing protein [Gaiellaceae bacterium]|jgi:plastocyanin|nr:cupredoxin domain-containing protein [Gaiellaceae bacterium]